MTDTWAGRILTNVSPLALPGDAPASDPRDIASWAEANVVLTGGDAPERFSLTGYQRAITEAISEPEVTVRFLSPSELRRLRGLSADEVLLMSLTAEAGGKILVYERTEGGADGR